MAYSSVFLQIDIYCQSSSNLCLSSQNVKFCNDYNTADSYQSQVSNSRNLSFVRFFFNLLLKFLIKLNQMQAIELGASKTMINRKLHYQQRQYNPAKKMSAKSMDFSTKDRSSSQAKSVNQSSNYQPLQAGYSHFHMQMIRCRSVSPNKRVKLNNNQSQNQIQKGKDLLFGRDEKIAFYLSPELEKFSLQHKLREKKPQIQYVNTLKKLKKAGKTVGCEVRAKSEGIQLLLSNDLQLKVEDELRFTVRKQFDRFQRKRLVKQSKNCCQQAANFNSNLQHSKNAMNDCLKMNQKDILYKSYDISRFQSYLKGKATKQRKYPYYIKKQIQQKFKKVNQKSNLGGQQDSEHTESLWDTKRNTFYSNYLPDTDLIKKFSGFSDAQSPYSSPKHSTLSRVSQYREDLIQFLQICQFYKKIQYEVLRYLPNNHISNKINTVISQVQYGDVIKKVYDKCDTDITQLTPNRIVNILKKYRGILSTMNYIVNIIKLNISAERRKRFVDIQKNISKFQNIISERKEVVCEKMKNIDNPQLKKNIKDTLLKAKVQCSGMDPRYTQFVKQGQQQQFSQINTFKNRKTICQILKFQSLMK